ncbi:MAG: hypothetical protein JW894_01555 [Bacteroidales bacterium]|nr:hypothetical protein [Bacteroidales bacterium]
MPVNLVKSGTVLKKPVMVFTDINSRINSLIDCSAKDFNTLNDNFQKYHKKINNLIIQLNSSCHSFIDIPENVMTDFEAQLNEISDILKKSYEYITGIDYSLLKLQKRIEHIYLKVNNLKQNVSTLKLLTTNIQFEPTYRKLYQEIIINLNDLSSRIHDLETKFQKIDMRIKPCSEITEQIKFHQIPLISQVLDRLKTLVQGYKHSQTEIKNYESAHEQLTTRHTSSSSAIIPNLKFQDIIKQNIEHVKVAHESIQKQLSNFSENGAIKGISEEINVEMLFKIRDIGALQAIQLVHANSEYQKTVENITEKFGELDDTLQKTKNLLYSLSPYNKSDNKFSTDSLNRSSVKFNLEINTFLDLNSNLNLNYTDLSRKVRGLIYSKQKNDHFIKSISLLFERIKPLINNQKINKNSSYIDQIIFSNKPKLKVIDKSDVETYFSMHKRLENIAGNFIETVTQKISKSTSEFILEPRPWNESDFHNSEFILDRLKYYKVFDKEIEEIIENLNQLLKQIDIGNLESEISTLSLEILKKLYTMESERIIHELYTGNKYHNHNNNNVVLF